jgi:hypothetical protein
MRKYGVMKSEKLKRVKYIELELFKTFNKSEKLTCSS